MFDLADPDSHRLEGEQALWVLAAKELPPGAILDIGMPKPHAEVLVGGHAAAPHGQPIDRMMLGWGIGSIRKQLLVTGDRYWQMTQDGWKPTRPQPFLQMPLAPQRSFGGEGFAANPIGTGYQAQRRTMGGEVVALPNVEIPELAVQLIENTPPPATFGPLAVDAKERLQYAGTYDAEWLKTVAPALALDADPRLFLFSPQDQRLPDFLKGGEPYVLQNFSAQHPVIRGQLPAFRVRCFIGWADASRGVVEVPTRIDTLWLFAGARRGIMIYRAALAVQELDGKDVADIMLAYERQDDPPRPLAHYLEVRRLRLDPQTAPRYAFSEHQLTPPLPQEELDRRTARRRELAEQRAQRQQKSMRWAVDQEMSRLDLPPALKPEIKLDAADLPAIPEILPEELESGEIDLAEVLDALEALELKVQTDLERKAAELEPVRASFDKISSGNGEPGDIDALLAAIGQPDVAAKMDEGMAHIPATPELQLPPDADPAKIADFEEKTGRAKNWRQEMVQVAPPAVDEGEQWRLAHARFFRLPEGRPLENVRKAISEENFKLPDVPPAAIPEEARNASREPQLRMTVEDIVAAVDNGQTPPEAVEKVRVALTQAEDALVKALPALAAGDRTPLEAFAPADQKPIADTPEDALAVAEAETKKALAGIASGLDSAEEQMLAGEVTMRRSSPEPLKPDVMLTPAVARTLGDVVEQEFRRGVSLAGRDFAGADLSGRDFSQADFSGALLERSKLNGAKLLGANLSQAALTGASLVNADLSRSLLANANLCKTDCRGARFSGSQLIGTLFLGARLEAAAFDAAMLQGLQMLQIPMMRATFRSARLHQCAFIQGNLANSEWDDAVITRTNFMDLSLAGAAFPGARLEQTSFMKVFARHLDFSACRLDQVAFVGEIDLRGARFDNCSANALSFNSADISGADFSMARIDGAFFGKANLAEAGFRMTSMKGAILTGNDLSGADFYAANLLEAHVNQADLTGASLRHANLYGADMMDSTLTAADLSDANLNRTIFRVGRHVS